MMAAPYARVVAIALTLAGCDACDDQKHFKICVCDTFSVDAPPVCNPLTQHGCAAGEKCTWLVDALMPVYVGHIGCAPAGTAQVGDACMYGFPGQTGYDNCDAGLVCGNFTSGSGVCKQLCDPQGGMPACDAQHACVTYEHLFFTGNTTPLAAGVCDIACDPIADNDFDGSGAMTKTGTSCGSSAIVGCYGFPSFGVVPRTAWTCAEDINAMVDQPVGLRHRVECTDTNYCASMDAVVRTNSCNQGYLPLLSESNLVSIEICVALCVPQNCFAGNCGPNDTNRLGMMPNRCNATDRVGTFDTSANGEHCLFSWVFEIDSQNNLLRSPTSDTLGFCFDHSKYPVDLDGDGSAAPLPPCATLPDGFGSGGTIGAADAGCVDTTHAMLQLQGKTPARHVLDDLRPLFRREMR